MDNLCWNHSLDAAIKDFFIGVLMGGLVLFCPGVALGDSPQYRHELSGAIENTTGFLRIYVGTSSYAAYALSGSYAYSLDRRYQLGVQTSLANSNVVNDSLRWSFYIPVTLNWGGEDLRSDFFGRVAPGIYYYNGTNWALLLQFGKRFKLLENISWRPTVGVVGYFGNGDPRTGIDIIPVVFSVLF